MRQPTPQQQQEATMTAKRAETRRRKGVPGVPEPSTWASWKDLERERDSGPVGAGATRGLRHSWSGRGGRVGWGENSLTSLLVRPSALVHGSHWLNPARSRAQGSLKTKTRGCRREKGWGGRGGRAPSSSATLTASRRLQPGQEGAGITQQEACALPTRLCHWRYDLWAPNKNVRPNASLSLSAPKSALLFFKCHHITSSTDGWKKYKWFKLSRKMSQLLQFKKWIL